MEVSRAPRWEPRCSFAGREAAYTAPSFATDPPGADIDVDGSFVGNTSSDVPIAGGEHTGAVKKVGSKTGSGS
ncbi:MAG TPA: PEGA domain-containing protein [Candidatus Polarisedimenticolia bacterium]|nr:PEGA domain-containing protein [Candidatus Polarisedimenticolia bacterium]